MENETMTTKVTTPETSESPVEEIIPSMDEFDEEISRSFRKWNEGDILQGTIIGISETELVLDLGSYSEGIVPLDEISNNPQCSIKADFTIGETLDAMIISEDNEGNLILSCRKAADILAWDALKTDLTERTIYSVKINEAVNGGAVTYLKGIRAFIPASQLSLAYVEDVSEFVGKTLDAIVITADEKKQKLVLSAKEVSRDRASAEKTSRISKLQKGIVTTGVVEKIMPFGAFVRMEDDLSGLVHISQICDRRIKSPNEVIKEGETVTVKIIDIKDGKVSLSMKAVEEEVLDAVDDAPVEYSSGETASTNLGALLSGFKFDN